jgi:hypothetical protein
MIFSTSVQSNLSIREYFRKIERYARLEGISNCDKRIQFLYGLNVKNKLKIKRLGLNKPLNNELIDTLEEIEKKKNEILLSENIYNPSIVQKALVN